MGNGNAAPQSSYALQSLGQSAKGGGAPAPGGQQFAPQVMPGQMFGQMPPGQAPQPMMPQQQQALMQAQLGQQAMAERQRALMQSQAQQVMPGQMMPVPGQMMSPQVQQMMPGQPMTPQAQQQALMQAQLGEQAMAERQRAQLGQLGQPMPQTVPPRYFSNRAAQNPILRNGIGAFNYFR